MKLFFVKRKAFQSLAVLLLLSIIAAHYFFPYTYYTEKFEIWNKNGEDNSSSRNNSRGRIIMSTIQTDKDSVSQLCQPKNRIVSFRDEVTNAVAGLNHKTSDLYHSIDYAIRNNFTISLSPLILSTNLNRGIRIPPQDPEFYYNLTNLSVVVNNSCSGKLVQSTCILSYISAFSPLPQPATKTLTFKDNLVRRRPWFPYPGCIKVHIPIVPSNNILKKGRMLAKQLFGDESYNCLHWRQTDKLLLRCKNNKIFRDITTPKVVLKRLRDLNISTSENIYLMTDETKTNKIQVLSNAYPKLKTMKDADLFKEKEFSENNYYIFAVEKVIMKQAAKFIDTEDRTRMMKNFVGSIIREEDRCYKV